MSHLPYVSVVVSQSCAWSVQQYWAGNPDEYEFVGVSQLAEAFQKSGISSEVNNEEDLEKGKKKPGLATEGTEGGGLDPLVNEKYVALLLLLLSCCRLFSLLLL